MENDKNIRRYVEKMDEYIQKYMYEEESSEKGRAIKAMCILWYGYTLDGLHINHDPENEPCFNAAIYLINNTNREIDAMSDDDLELMMMVSVQALRECIEGIKLPLDLRAYKDCDFSPLNICKILKGAYFDKSLEERKGVILPSFCQESRGSFDKIVFTNLFTTE